MQSKCTVICSLAAAVENQIAKDVIVSAKLIIEIYVRAWSIVEDVWAPQTDDRSIGSQSQVIQRGATTSNVHFAYPAAVLTIRDGRLACLRLKYH